jgi:hypothetical protein
MGGRDMKTNILHVIIIIVSIIGLFIILISDSDD